MKLNSICIALLLLWANIALFGQSKSLPPEISNYFSLQQNAEKLKMNAQSDLYLINQYTDEGRGITYYYVGQQKEGIPIKNAQTTLYRGKDGVIKQSQSRFIETNTTSSLSAKPGLSIGESVTKAAEYFGILVLSPRTIDPANSQFIFPALSPNKIQPKLVWLAKNNKLQLVYEMEVMPAKGEKMWQIYVDATDGSIVDKESLTTSCSFGEGFLHSQDQCDHTPSITMNQPIGHFNPLAENAKYRVFELPAEAPSFAASKLVINPSDPIASPFGWHDADGSPSVDNTTLNGQNVYAFNDADGDYQPNNDVDGGQELNFDKPYDFVNEPASSKDAAAINLFYMVNMMHDFSYHFGLDEEAGNFQRINYTNKGADSDQVQALSQYSNGTTEKNNADFSTPTDGSSGVMRMFLWDRGSSIFEITAPDEIKNSYDVGTAAFGPAINSTPVQSAIVYANDVTGGTHNFCEEAENAAEMAGKIVLIDRGLCDFSQKVYNAQENGAIGAIIVNFENAVINMASGSAGGSVNIPSVFVSKATGDLIKQQLANGKEVVAKFERPETSGPAFLDASLDNGIIAHEYGHGISNRLTGGPQNTSCLANDEQMGEGWSDFFALVTTRRPGDVATTSRGIGTYALEQPTNGVGIRTYPYSTDMTINPHTMEDIIGSTGPHYLGEIWATTLWDLYWKMTEKYGDDHLLYGGTGGNSMAVNLVMQGMKLQPCRPGLLDGRDAILDADSLLYNGENTCLIWEVFARRGMGYFADQGSSNSRNDNISDYTSYPFCLNKLLISKTMTKEVDPEGIIDLTIKVTNYTSSTSKTVTVTDLLPEHTSFVDGSGGTLSNGIVTLSLDSLAKGEFHIFSYQVKVDADYKSILMASDPIETDDNNVYITSAETGNVFFKFESGTGPNGENVYAIKSDNAAYKSSLLIDRTMNINGSHPSLIINHKYSTLAGTDGGIVDWSTDGNIFNRFHDEFYRGGPFIPIAYTTFSVPSLLGFSGQSDGYINSFFDVNELKGKDIYLQFKYGSAGGGITNGGGWWINRADLVDAVFVNSEACVTADNLSPECASADELGTYVRYNNSVANKVIKTDLAAIIYPNPGLGSINVNWSQPNTSNAEIEVVNSTSTKILTEKFTATSGNNYRSIDLRNYPPGMYFIKINSGNKLQVVKYIKL